MSSRADCGLNDVVAAIMDAGGPELNRHVHPENQDIPPYDGNVPDLRDLNYTDLGNAERLHTMYGRDFRWCFEMRKWLTWDGRRWSSDSLEQRRKMAVRTMRQFYMQAGELESDRRKGGGVGPEVGRA